MAYAIFYDKLHAQEGLYCTVTNHSMRGTVSTDRQCQI